MELKPLAMGTEDTLKLMKEEEVFFVDLQFTDLVGRLRHVTIPSEMVDESSLREGFAKLDGSSVKGFLEIHESDMVLKPDVSTIGIIPWTSERTKTARMLCDVYMGYNQGRFSRDPRYIAQKAEEMIRNQGFTHSFWGPEVEFFVFRSASWQVNNPFDVGYRVSSPESPEEAHENDFPIRYKDGYYPADPIDTLTEFRSVCVNYLKEGFGILCNAHHHEVATAGQCEIDMYRDELTKMADNVMTYKFVIRNVAKRMGMIATTMPKPIFGDNAAGMHVHSSLWKREKNMFYDKDDAYAEISQTARYFIGGLLEHSKSLCAIVAPTTNSYKRLVPGYEAPVYIAWSKSNRSANVRVPVYQKGKEESKRIEFRTPDPSCNPYLAFAAIASAGIDGIVKKIDPGDPVDQDIYKLTEDKRRELGIGVLPGSLAEAIDNLRSDNEYLKAVFTQDVLDTLVEIEIKEHKEVSARPHPYEFYLYFDR